MWNLFGLGVVGFVAHKIYSTDIVLAFTESVMNDERIANTFANISKLATEIPYYCDVSSAYILFKTRGCLSEMFESGKVESSRDKYTVTYYHGPNRYKSIFPKRRGLLGISNVSWNGKDVTKEFGELLGPGHNFHGTNPTPKFLGYEGGLKIDFMNGGTLEYGSDELIVF